MPPSLNPGGQPESSADIPPVQPMDLAIQKPDASSGVIIPGPEQPRFLRRENQPLARPIGPIRFVRLIRSQLIGDRFVPRGEVVKVNEIPIDPRTGRPVVMTIMPVMPILLSDRAQKMLEDGTAEPCGGPATVELGASMSLEKT